MKLMINQKALMQRRQASPNYLTIRDQSSLSKITFHELMFYLYLYYSILSAQLGISVKFFGAGWLALLAIFSIMQRGPNRPQTFLLILVSLTAGSYLFIQIIIHGQNLMDPYVQPMVSWVLLVLAMCGLIDKPGFLFRLAIVMFVIALLAYPFASWEVGSRLKERASAGGTGIANANDLAAWVGFTVLIFLLRFLQTPGLWKRLLLGTCAIIGLIIMMQTLSRGALVALAGGLIVVLLETKIKQKFILALLISLLCFAVFETSIAEQGIKDYEARMQNVQKSGRIPLFFASLEEFLRNPWLGVGARGLEVSVEGGPPECPHNGFLLFGVAAGIVPFSLFAGLWLAALFYARSYRSRKSQTDVGALSVVMFALLETMVSNLYWMHPWAVAAILYSAVIRNNDKVGSFKRAYHYNFGRYERKLHSPHQS